MLNMGISLLIKGIETIIDPEDHAKCSLLNWSINKDGYFYTTGTLYLHRYILDAKKGQIVDHINGNKLDNRKSNLRFVTPIQNSMNKTLRKDNESGFHGVRLNKVSKKWVAYITVQGKSIFLGSFVNQNDAIKIRTQAEQKYFGDYARKVVI